MRVGQVVFMVELPAGIIVDLALAWPLNLRRVDRSWGGGGVPCLHGCGSDCHQDMLLGFEKALGGRKLILTDGPF